MSFALFFRIWKCTKIFFYHYYYYQIVSFQIGENVSISRNSRRIIQNQQERVDGLELLKSIELLKKIYPKFLLSVEHACNLLALYLFVWHNLAAVQTLHVERGYQTRRNWFECTIWHIWAKFAILRRSGGLGEKRSIWSAISNCSYSWESNAAFKHANSEYLVNCAQWVQNW